MTDNEVKWLIVGKLLRRNLMAGVGGEQWETLFEGDVTTERNDSYSGAYCGGLALTKAIGSNNQGNYRLTVDGVTINKTLSSATTGYINIGNSYLRSESAEDSGEDFLVCITSLFAVSWKEFYFLSRNPGTYNIKIERMVS